MMVGIFPKLSTTNTLHRRTQSALICMTSTTAAGLDRLLPWIFYHKVIGVSDFFLFVEGAAATTNSCDIPAATTEDVEVAVVAARKALTRNKGTDWGSATGAHRAKYLRVIASKA